MKLKKQRLHLAMPLKTRELLEKLQQRTEAGSMTEVIRRALALFDVAIAEHEKGNKLFIHSGDGTQTRIRFL